jgi:hypothetical protein
MPSFGLPSASGAIASVKKAIQRTIETQLDKICSNPEEIIEAVIANDKAIQLLISGYTAFGWRASAVQEVESLKKQIREAIRSVKENPEFVKACMLNQKNAANAEKLTILILDTIFTSKKVNIIEQNDKMKERYNRLKRVGFDVDEADRLKQAEKRTGGRRKTSHKKRTRKHTTYRRRR